MEEERTLNTHALIYCSLFFTLDIMSLWLGLPCHDGLQPGILSQIDPFSFKLILLGYFCHSKKKQN